MWLSELREPAKEEGDCPEMTAFESDKLDGRGPSCVAQPIIRPLQVVYRFLVRRPQPISRERSFGHYLLRSVVLMVLHLSRFDCLPTMNFCGHISQCTNDIMSKPARPHLDLKRL